ncbi:hypothetical protein B0H11DRAFT_2268030 [Mycena galericulata]|nr:hypothetical protein B0H11DRAFT_2268030 [Mycena galericulata]
MHPAFAKRNLKRLPLPIREIAEAACRDNRSIEHVLTVTYMMSRIPSDDRVHLLPVFYANLDPTRIPSSDDLESFHPETRTNIRSAAAVLVEILQIRFALDISVDIWPRIWAWFSFLETYRPFFPETRLPKEEELFTGILLFTTCFQDEKEYSRILSTPGVLRATARAWAFLIRADEQLSELQIYLLGYFMLCFRHSAENNEEVIEGAGGSVKDLCRLVAGYLDAALQTPVTVPEFRSLQISGVLSFINNFDFHPTAHCQWFNLPLGPLCRRLLNYRFVELLVDAMLRLVEFDTVDSEMAGVLDDCFVLLGRILTTGPGYLWLPEAIETGLLVLIVACSFLDLGEQIEGQLEQILRRILFGNLVYYYVIVQVKRGLPIVEDLISVHPLKQFAILETWTQFNALATERIQLMESFSVDLVSTRACDNVECGEIRDRTSFRRCSGCQAFYYCSQRCQMDDWRSGGHRKVCGGYGYLGLTSQIRSTLVTRERAFLRALLDHDYQAHRASICAKQVEFMAARPDSPFFTSFDYIAGTVNIGVESAVDESVVMNMLVSSGAEWSDTLRRAVESNGRIQLHIMQIVEGDTTRFWVVPLRTSSSSIHCALRELASRVRADSGAVDVAGEIDAVLREFAEVQEIH